MSDKPSRYAAFISYRHLPRDRLWAQRALNALETFQTPTALRRQGYPPRPGRVFRDEDEIPASADLSDEIRHALEQSDTLIVVCSPETPASRWVRQEIAYFQDLGRGDRIIPLLIAGEPEDSFPAELRRRRTERPDEAPGWAEIEPIAADVRKRDDEAAARTWRRAVLRLAAAMLGCRYDDLARRDAERRAKSRLRWAAVAGAAALAIGLGGVAWWDAALRIKTEYCAAITERWAVPSCLGTIDAEAQSRRAQTWRLHIQAGRVLDMARINGQGTPITSLGVATEDEIWAEPAGAWRFGYRAGAADGLLESVELEAPSGRRVRQIHYDFAPDRSVAVARFDQDLGIAARQNAEASSLGAVEYGARREDRQSSIAQHRVWFDSVGHITRRDFEPVGGGTTIADATGSYGTIYGYDDTGRIHEIRNLDANGGVMIDRVGIAGQRRSYDARGDLQSLTWFGADGNPTPTSQFFAVIQIQRDPSGNPVREDYRDVAGLLIARADRGMATLLSQYDAHGNQTEEHYLGADGSPVLSRTQNAAGIARRFDDRGLTISLTYLGFDGHPVLGKTHGAARIDFQYDTAGRVVGERYFARDGSPAQDKVNGVFQISWRFDARGQRIEEAYFDPDGRPVQTHLGGFARIAWRHDARGNNIETAFFAADGRPAINQVRGLHRSAWGYDARGNMIHWAAYDPNGHPVIARSTGSAAEDDRYDERGNLIEMAFFGPDGKPIVPRGRGAARLRFDRDARGNATRITYWNSEGGPMTNTATGVARIDIAFDASGNRIEQRYYDLDGKPAREKRSRAARQTWAYDRQGRVVDAAIYGIDGLPMIYPRTGIARTRSRYDIVGNLIEESYEGIDGAPVAHFRTGAARATWRYDQFGRQVEETLAFPDGASRAGALRHPARTRWTYDAAGNRTRTEYFDAAGNPTADEHGAAALSDEFDLSGRVISHTEQDPVGNLLALDGIAVHKVTIWGDDNRIAGVIYRDGAGRPVSVEVTIAALTWNSPAYAFGLRIGDVLLAMDGAKLTSQEQLFALFSRASPRVITWRRGSVMSAARLPPIAPGADLGITLRNVRAPTLGAP